MVLGNPGGKVLIYLPINEGFIPFPFRSFFTKMTRHEMDFNGLNATHYCTTSECNVLWLAQHYPINTVMVMVMVGGSLNSERDRGNGTQFRGKRKVCRVDEKEIACRCSPPLQEAEVFTAFSCDFHDCRWSPTLCQMYAGAEFCTGI